MAKVKVLVVTRVTTTEFCEVTTLVEDNPPAFECVQNEGADMVAGVQVQPAYTWQVDEHPSLFIVFPSSQPSPAFGYLFPHKLTGFEGLMITLVEPVTPILL